MQVFGFSGHNQGRFRPVSARFGLFRPFSGLFRPYRQYWPLADTSRYGRYGSILVESARFGANRSRFGTNRAASARIEPSRRESEKKKKKKKKPRRGPTRGQPRRTPRPASRRVGRGCSTPGATSVLSSSGQMDLSLMKIFMVLTLHCTKKSSRK